MSAINRADVQGLVLHAYRRLPHASYVLLRFGDSPAASRGWLAEFVDEDRIDNAVSKEIGPPGSPLIRVNIALTCTGLRALGVDDRTLATFPLEFVEGLGAPWPSELEPDHRSRILGDTGDSRPEQWEWGYQGDHRRVDAILLAFSKDAVDLDLQVAAWLRKGEASGAIERHARTLWGDFPDKLSEPNREHFGFVDGISQPVLKGALDRLRQAGSPRQPQIQEIDDGELLLGHRDGSRQIAKSPTVDAGCEGAHLLPRVPDHLDRRDLGYNGTYLVFRQLEQNVAGFRDACRSAARTLDLDPDHVAALIVGRWQNGSPLASAPMAHDRSLAQAPAANDFTYGGDPHGERCPMGAHIRRANPRDSLGDDPAASLVVANRHRILRRGRPFRLSKQGSRSGLHFIGLNASISRQFEFVQQNWINNPTFGGLVDQDDPLLGCREGVAAGGRHSLPPSPENRVAREITGLKRYVTVLGGGYFFLPSLTALRYLSHATPAPIRAAHRRLTPDAVTMADKVRALVLARFSLLSAFVLAALPIGLFSPIAATLVRPTFELDHLWEMLVVAALASLAAAGAHLTFRIVQLYARARFDVACIAAPLTWRVVFTWQAFSIPAVGTAWWLSAQDAAWNVRPLWQELLWFGGAVLAGYVLAFALLYTAAAARQAWVRSDNPEDALLIPLTAHLQRLKARPSAIARIAHLQPSALAEIGETKPPLLARFSKPVVEFVENRAAMLRDGAGAGYVHHGTGHVLPGHLTGVILVMALGLIYAVGLFVLRPPTRLQLPPLAYLLFVVLVVGLATSGASFFLDKFRIPLVTIILSWFAFATYVGGTDHEFALQGPLRGALGVVESIAQSDAFYRTRTGKDPNDRPVVVVVAGGGGIRQAAWTAQVLAGLTNLWEDRFSGNVQMVSAVSAGGVGALHFLKGYSDQGPPLDGVQAAVRAAETSASGDIWWGLTYPDAMRALVTFPFKPLLLKPTMDRGWAIETAWQRSLAFKDSHTLNQWRDDVAKGWRPAVGFNATVVETGRRAVLATYELPFDRSVDDARVVTNSHDLSLVTAARLSAAFPYVTPVARPTGYEANGHLADGGYWDNSGLISAVEWLRAAAPILRTRDVLVINIAPAALDDTQVHDRAWVWQLTAPLAGLLSVRTDDQRARNRIAVESLRAAWQGNITFATIGDRDPAAAGEHPVVGKSLGWHLSRQERCGIEQQWQKRADNEHDPELWKIDKVLKNRRFNAVDLSTGCAQ